MFDDCAARPDEPDAPKGVRAQVIKVDFARLSHERDCEREQRLKAVAERVVRHLTVAQLEALRESLRRFEDD